MPLAVVPKNVPLSSVTMGQVVYVEGKANTVAVATHTATSSSLRKTMTAREKDYRTARGTSARIMRRKADFILGNPNQCNQRSMSGVSGKIFMLIQ